MLWRWIQRRTGIPFDIAIKKRVLDVVCVLCGTAKLSGELVGLITQLLEGAALNQTELGLSYIPNLSGTSRP